MITTLECLSPDYRFHAHNGHLAHFLFCTRHELHMHCYVFPRCMDGALSVSDALSISDRFLGPLSGACAARSSTATHRRIGTLTMKIGYLLDMDDVWRIRQRHKTAGQLEALGHTLLRVVCMLRRLLRALLVITPVLCPPPSLPIHPSRTETNDHFIVVRASCTPIHRRIIIGNTPTVILALLEWMFPLR